MNIFIGLLFGVIIFNSLLLAYDLGRYHAYKHMRKMMENMLPGEKNK